MRVLMTADTVGGVWTYAIDLCTELSRRGVDVTLVTLGPPMSADQQRAAAAVPRLTVVEIACRLEWMADPWDDVTRSGEALLDAAVRLRPDVVHLNTFGHASLPWRAMGMPLLLVGHSCVETWWRAVKGRPTGEQWKRYREVVGRGIHDADVFVAPTRAMLRAFTECYGRHDGARVIHNGRSAGRFRPGVKQPFVLAAGRLWDEAKNITALEEASQWIGWPVRLAGEADAPGTPGASEGGAASANGALAGVQRLGHLTPDELAAQMAAASIYALPARYEPFGLSAVEAALCGCALVLGDIPTLREVWGDAAVFVDPEDPRALAAAVNQLIRHRDKRQALAGAARERARRYTVDAMADRYLSLYRSMARVRRRAQVAEAQGVPA